MEGLLYFNVFNRINQCIDMSVHGPQKINPRATSGHFWTWVGPPYAVILGWCSFKCPTSHFLSWLEAHL